MRKIINIQVFTLAVFIAFFGVSVIYFWGERQVLYYSKVSFSDLRGWEDDQHDDALSSFKISCVKILQKPLETVIKPEFTGGVAKDWREVCTKAQNISAAGAKGFFEQYFTALRFNPETEREEMEGTFTGYYAPEYEGSPIKTELYNVPLYKTPSDLQVLNLGDFDASLQGKYIIGQVKDKKFTPYNERKIIDEGALKNQGLELVWLKSKVDSFFLEIQGSGVIYFKDGTRFQVSYAGKNGRPYRAVGRFLIESGDIKLEDMSMQAIRAWLEKNPENMDDLLWKNPSFVFFKTKEEEGIVGAMGVNLTAGRSLAVDNHYIPYGAPLWLETTSPISNLSRLVIAQDTGGAIRGKIRGDIFWGTGDKAALIAGPMNDKGIYYLLLPKKLAQRLLENLKEPS